MQAQQRECEVGSSHSLPNFLNSLFLLLVTRGPTLFVCIFLKYVLVKKYVQMRIMLFKN